MSGKMLLTARLDQRLLMNQKLKQVITFLQYTTVELKQQIKEMIETNPLLEVNEEIESEESEASQPEEDAAWQSHTGVSVKNNHHSEAHDDYIQNIPSIKTLREHLIEQTYHCHFSVIDQEIAIRMIDAIDEDGYFSMSSEEMEKILVDEFGHDASINIDNIHAILTVIQGFEPLGIGARHTAECLKIQLEATCQQHPAYHFAKKIIEINALQLSHVDFKALTKLSGLSSHALTDGLSLLHTLDFHPAKSFHHHGELVQDPELYVRKTANEWRVFLTDSILTKLDVNEHYRHIIKKNTRDKSYKTVLDQLQQANLLVNGIKRRNETLLAVAGYLVKAQTAFFDEGRSALKSINMAEVAAALDYHESTISRITTGKYISTPHGIFELKYFFPSHVKTQSGSDKSSTSVKLMIENIISKETQHQTFSDEQIAEMLKKSGIHISRRTVTKYREALKIPSSYLRSGINAVRQLIEEDKDLPIHETN